MRVLITGASGFLGRYTLLMFQELGHEVIPLDIKSSGIKNEIVCDLQNASQSELNNIVKDINVIVHLASEVDFSESLSISLFKMNTIVSFHLAKAAAFAGAKFIFSSAMLVHGVDIDYIDEKCRDNPNTPYMMSKWIAEELIEETVVESTILRIGGLFGLNGPAHLGINRTIMSALKSKTPPKVIAKGMAKRNYIYVKDAAKWICYIAENNIYKKVYIAGKNVLSISEMADMICSEYLSGECPSFEEGKDTHDQICKISEPHPPLLSFREALIDIKAEYEKNSCNK